MGGGAGGYHTGNDYRQIVAYAAARFVTVVPEIDLPGHTNASRRIPTSTATAGLPIRNGHKGIMPPANHAYLEQRYDAGTRIGLAWAGPTSVQSA